jgi:hypothetical protein
MMHGQRGSMDGGFDAFGGGGMYMGMPPGVMMHQMPYGVSPQQQPPTHHHVPSGFMGGGGVYGPQYPGVPGVPPHAAPEAAGEVAKKVDELGSSLRHSLDAIDGKVWRCTGEAAAAPRWMLTRGWLLPCAD